MYIVIGIVILAVLIIFCRYGSMSYGYENHKAHGYHSDNKPNKKLI